MKVLLFNGSPKQNGCTHTALSVVAGELEKAGIAAEIVHIAGEAAGGAELEAVIQRARDADGLVFGSPVHYAGMSAILKGFLDSLFGKAGGEMGLKPGAALVSARRHGSSSALDQMGKYFTNAGMPIVSGRYWNAVHGNTPEEVRRDEEGIQVMESLGRNMAWLLQCIQAGKAAGIQPPHQEPKVRTSFIR